MSEAVKEQEFMFSVYFERLEYTLISQSEKTTLSDLVANVGGTFGLFIGISFLSFLEILEVLVTIYLRHIALLSR